MQNVLIFDTETTGLPPKGADYKTDFNAFPYIVQMAWWMNGVLKDAIIKPNGYVIPDEAALIHGITTEIAIEKGRPLNEVMIDFFTDCQKAEKIVAHNIYFDTSILKANVLRMGWTEAYDQIVEPSLDKDKRICTMMKTIKFVQAPFANGRGGFKYPTLEELHIKLFGESFPAHNAIEDVNAIIRCIKKLAEVLDIEI